MTATAAIFYLKDGYHTGGQKLYGRQAASEGFLKGFVQHGTADRLYCYTAEQSGFAEFCEQVKPWLPGQRDVHWLPYNQPQQLAQLGAVFRPDSVITSLVWERRFVNQRAYSICGMTHSIASKDAMEDLGKLLLAPVQPWDALVCPSPAVKTVVERLWATWSEYLAKRTGGNLQPEMKLPVIPLGVDCAAFPQGEQAQAIRHNLRTKWEIGQADIVVLYVGRLSFSTKAHPVPMFMALERAAQTTGATIHLVLAGWFENEAESTTVRDCTQMFCPSVITSCVDGRSPTIRANVWSIADIFLSLADNIQETFGLTPIEAMAAGLPTIVSDWNGYQASVRHEIDGFRIPTVLPPAGVGLDLAWEQLSDGMPYSAYVAHTAITTAIDIDACTQALTTLITNPDLRTRMGASARQRAEQVYDWNVVIAAYETLWQELAEIRAIASEVAPLAPNEPPYPLVDDPFRLFAHYPTTGLRADHHLKLGAMAKPEPLAALRYIGITGFGAERRLALEVQDAMLSAIAANGSLPVSTLLRDYANNDPAALFQTLLHLLKFDVLQLER
ncbi:MAG: glycosyltransferase family 4 protein [Lyngbya sp. HA4199-MV5]|jgi:glycosyltransferase involved in cell wall biosynthesis|nr:glycosyltransferase family 4 protein [Lyngbya sp. HA4199-MV5]